MDASIVNFIERNQRNVDKIVDTTFFRLLEPITVLDRYIPLKSYANRKLLLLKFKGHRPTVGSVVAEEQEVPASSARATLDESLLSNLKLGKKLIWKARDFELMHELMRYAREAGPLGTQMQNDIKAHFFGQIADLVPCLVERHTVLTLLVACTGACDFTDPLTGARVELTYPDTIPALLPAALTGGARWSQPTTTTPLTNLETHARAYYDELGMWPFATMMHFAQLRQIADSTEAKVAMLRKMGADSTTPDVTGMYLTDQMAIDLVKERTRGNVVEIFDAQYSEEDKNGNITDKPFLPENYYVFMREGYLERALVPTVEKDFQPGVYLHSKVVEESPRVERTVAVANGLPFCADERYIAARKVA